MWIILGLLTAIFDASKNVLAKHNTKQVNSLVLGWGLSFWSLLILFPLMFTQPFPHVTTAFWLAFIIQVILYLISLYLYMEALRHSDLSLSLPMLAFSPVLIIFTSLAINHEFPHPLGILGVGFVVLGVYLLHFKKKGLGLQGFFKPFQELSHNKGVMMMFGVSCIWGLSSSLDKFAILHSTPLFYSGLEVIALVMVLTPIVVWQHRKDVAEAFRWPRVSNLIILGLLDGSMTVTQMYGQTLTLSVFIISLKRTSIVFSTLLAYFFFKEKIRDRILPICLMVAGVVMIALS